MNILKRTYYKARESLFFSGKVNFLVCGTQKGGTTALAEYLNEHSEICMASQKEVHFFDKAKLPDYSRYHAFFSPQKGHKVIGEATPVYMYLENVPQRIYDYNPEMKLIMVLRDPVERAYSHWNMTRTRGLEPLPFREAIESEQARCEHPSSLGSRRFSYVERGHYFDQLKRIWALFPRENTLILRNDELKNMPEETLGKVSKFLDVSPFKGVEQKQVHARQYNSKITEEDRNFLKDKYREGIKQLEKELDWDCSGWLK